MALPVGAAILSLLVFLLLLTGAAFATSFLALGVCALIPQLWRPSLPEPNVKHEPVDRITAWILTGIFSPTAPSTWYTRWRPKSSPTLSDSDFVTSGDRHLP